MMPATVRPLPTPAPSPMRKPARCPLGSRTSCRCGARGRSQGLAGPPRCAAPVGGLGYLAGVGDGLQLQGRQGVAVRGGQGEAVGDVRRRDAGQRAGLHHAVWVLLADLGCRGVTRTGQGMAGGFLVGCRRAGCTGGRSQEGVGVGLGGQHRLGLLGKGV